jgi:hypothetical protein
MQKGDRCEVPPFLHALPKAMARSMTFGDVCNAGMISTSFLTYSTHLPQPIVLTFAVQG